MIEVVLILFCAFISVFVSYVFVLILNSDRHETRKLKERAQFKKNRIIEDLKSINMFLYIGDKNYTLPKTVDCVEQQIYIAQHKISTLRKHYERNTKWNTPYRNRRKKK